MPHKISLQSIASTHYILKFGYITSRY